eukprot:PhF_6_TR11196/c1_g1_i2/m.18052
MSLTQPPADTSPPSSLPTENSFSPLWFLLLVIPLVLLIVLIVCMCRIRKRNKKFHRRDPGKLADASSPSAGDVKYEPTPNQIIPTAEQTAGKPVDFQEVPSDVMRVIGSGYEMTPRKGGDGNGGGNSGEMTSVVTGDDNTGSDEPNPLEETTLSGGTRRGGKKKDQGGDSGSASKVTSDSTATVSPTDDQALHLLANQVQELSKLSQGKKANMDVIASVLNGPSKQSSGVTDLEDTTADLTKDSTLGAEGSMGGGGPKVPAPKQAAAATYSDQEDEASDKDSNDSD